ncbi:MAG: saccharopine dehydrogenase, partial [Bacteroidia bacterium]|nr:saccharopine dehydrogenase [Bacteroidia bacterium]
MQKILILGAGRSASSLIKYAIENASALQWELSIGDYSLELAQEKAKGHSHIRAFQFDVNDEVHCEREVGNADMVISMLPARFHNLIAKHCVILKKNMVTASYVSKEMQAMHDDAKSAGIILLNEVGVDPGIDHMSAKKVLDELARKGAKLNVFRSFTGGLIAPEYATNPWKYRFTWNPRNVILAGQGTARFIEDNKLKYIPYKRVFKQFRNVHVDGVGDFDGYANRDSIQYRTIYGLRNIPTMVRGTLRYPGYCEAWSVFVTLGLTDDSFQIKNSEHLTYAELVESFLPRVSSKDSLIVRLANLCGLDPNGESMRKVEWTGILSDEKIGLANATPAQVLQHLLMQKWTLQPDDKDMIVMQHEFIYELDNTIKQLNSALVVKGDDSTYTAMAKTVGYPVAICAKLISQGKYNAKGVQIPLDAELYNPVLDELETLGIKF